MNSYVIDAWAWVEYLIGSEHGTKVKEILDDESNEIYTCALTLAEIVSKVAREKKDVQTAYSLLLSNSQIIDADEELSKKAGELHAQMRQTTKDFGLADAYILATAKKLKSKILTGDAHFNNLINVVLLK